MHFDTETDSPLRLDMVPQEPPTLESLAGQVDLLFRFIGIQSIVIKNLQIRIDEIALDREIRGQSYDNTLTLILKKQDELETALATAGLVK